MSQFSSYAQQGFSDQTASKVGLLAVGTNILSFLLGLEQK